MADVHPDLAHVSQLLGVWSGVGHGEYSTIEPFDYAETVTFGHVGKPFLTYEQRTRKLFADGTLGPPMHAEAGYWRFPSADRVELVLAHPTGVVELQEGAVHVRDHTIRIEVASSSIVGTRTAKEVATVERTFRLVGDDLRYDVWMAAVGQPLQHHLSAALTQRDPD